VPRRLIACLVLALAASHAIGQGKGATALYSKWKASIYQIEVEKADGEFTGTAFLFSKATMAVTCNHVVQGARSILIRSGGKTWKPSRIACDKSRDLALLYFDKALPSTPFQAAANAEVGQPVVIIGNPMGLSNSLTTGVVSAQRRLDGVSIIQTSAPISEGSSGSPVISEQGRVLGVVSFFLARGQNLNMAVSVDELRGLVKDPAKQRSVSEFTRVPALEKKPAGKPLSGSEKKRWLKALSLTLGHFQGSVTSAFVHWMTKSAEWGLHKNGVYESEVDAYFEDFLNSLIAHPYLNLLGNCFEQIGELNSYRSYLDALSGLARISKDAHMSFGNLIKEGPGMSPDAFKGARKDYDIQYTRLTDALLHLEEIPLGLAGFDQPTYDQIYPNSGKGETLLLTWGVFVEPDNEGSTLIVVALESSRFRSGDWVDGVREKGATEWLKLRTWNDLWVFNEHHPVVPGEVEFRVYRDGKLVTVK
jgi:serine protease Do